MFPNVPIDERLFESNDMMRQYWERSTDNRGVHFVADARFDADPVMDDMSDLRSLSVEAFEPVRPAGPSNAAGFFGAVVLPKSDETVVVTPQAVATTPDAGNYMVVALAVAILGYFTYFKSGRRH